MMGWIVVEEGIGREEEGIGREEEEEKDKSFIWYR
jgi:hypothetical protein